MRDQRDVKRDGWICATQSGYVPIFSQNGDPEFGDIEVQAIGGRFRCDGGQSTGKTSEACVIRCFVDRKRFDRIGRHGNSEAAGDRISVPRRIDDQQALILVRTFEYQFAVKRPHYARS